MANRFNVRCTILNLLHCDLPSIKTSPFCHPTKNTENSSSSYVLSLKIGLCYVSRILISLNWSRYFWTIKGVIIRNQLKQCNNALSFSANPSQNYHNISIKSDFPPKNGCHLNDPTINRGAFWLQKKNAQGRCLADALAPLPCGFGLLRQLGNHLPATKNQTGLAFHCTGCLIGILIMVCHNPFITK